MKVRCVVACRNASGEPDFFFCIVPVSQEDYEEGVHYDLAIQDAHDNGYEGRYMVVCDEFDPGFRFFEDVDWQVVPVTGSTRRGARS